MYNSNDAFVFAVNHKNEKVYIYYTNKVVIYDLHSKTTETVNLDITISSANYGIYYSYISEL
ncbi:MAG: hypothetical protein LBQ24_02330 [Candidatus Peribacteria bacterium]|nr:hypothetical protein [Candidatus Peribacteria bacterium]